MTALTYLGNCSSVIDWDNVVRDIENTDPDRVGPPEGRPGLEEIRNCWEKAGYKSVKDGGSVEWNMYFPHESFDITVVDRVLDYFEIPDYSACWISKINPGCCAAPHFDQMETDKPIQRLHVHIADSRMGHVFYVGNEYIIDYKKGDAYKWNDPFAWHAGMNCGLTPKYMLNVY